MGSDEAMFSTGMAELYGERVELMLVFLRWDVVTRGAILVQYGSRLLSYKLLIMPCFDGPFSEPTMPTRLEITHHGRLFMQHLAKIPNLVEASHHRHLYLCRHRLFYFNFGATAIPLFDGSI